MHISCPNTDCDNQKRFLIPLWVRCTFRFNEDGTISILHFRQLESLEEKLTGQGTTEFALTCQECGEPADITFNEFEADSEAKAEKQALEGL